MLWYVSSPFTPYTPSARLTIKSFSYHKATPTLQDGNFRAVLTQEVTEALGRAFGDQACGADPMVTPATRPEFGDYQCNAALALAKALKSKPRDVAVS